MAADQVVSGSIEAMTSIRQPLHALLASVRSSGAILGPLVGLLIWMLPLDLDPLAHKALAVAGFVLTYWITKPIDYGMTALFGCVLFWTLQITSFPIAFSGFATPTPWFVFGGLLMGEAAACTGLAKRLGFLLLRPLGASYSRLSLGLVTLVWLLSFLIPPANGLLATLVPIGLGIVVASGLGPQSNLARGLFVILTYSSSLFGKMLLGGGKSVCWLMVF